jgi:hypothetical protein
MKMIVWTKKEKALLFFIPVGPHPAEYGGSI